MCLASIEFSQAQRCLQAENAYLEAVKHQSYTVIAAGRLTPEEAK